jgi:hypothetical protein
MQSKRKFPSSTDPGEVNHQFRTPEFPVTGPPVIPPALFPSTVARALPTQPIDPVLASTKGGRFHLYFATGVAG